jgi:hypothetical protein
MKPARVIERDPKAQARRVADLDRGLTRIPEIDP